jgi:hypothetical protein
MVDPKTGEVFNNVPDDEVQRATDQFGLVSADHYAMLQKYGGIADQAAAAGKTAANVATFGLAGFDSAEDKQQIQTFKESSPTLAALSEIAGAAAPGALGGGAAGLVMRGLGASARAAQIGGVVAEEVAQSAAIEAEHAREEGRGIELGSVVMGLPLAMGVSAAGRLARGAARRVRGIPEGGPASLLDAAEAEGNALAQGRRTSEARRSVGAAGSGPDGRPPLTEDEVRSYARGRDEIHAQVERFGGDAIEDAAAGTAPAFDEVHNISLKKSDLAGKMNDADPELMAEFADGHGEAVESLASKLEAGGHKAAAAQLRAHLAEVARYVDEPADLNISWDRTKRTLDRLRSRYGALARKDIRAEAVVDDIDEVLEPIRQGLEDADTWGTFAAEKQAGENKLWSGDDGIIRSGAVWQHEFLERLPGAAGRMRRGLQDVPVFKVRGDVVGHALAMKPRDFALVMNAMGKWIDNVEAMSLLKTELGAQSVGTTPIVRLQQGLEDMKTLRDELITLREAEKRGSAVIAKEAAKDSARGTAEILFEAAEEVPGLGGPLKGGRRLVEKATGRPLFDAPVKPPEPELTREAAGQLIRDRRSRLGKLSPRAKKPRPGGAAPAAVAPLTSLADQLSDLGDAGSRAARGASAAGREPSPVTDSLAEISDNSRAIQERAALGLVSKESRPPKLPPLAERFKEGAKDIGQAFQNKIEHLKKANEDPQAFVDGMVDTFGPMAEGGHEDLYAKVVARVQIGVQYLLANAPPSVGISMVRPDGIPPDSLAVMKWAAMWDGVFNPGNVVYDVATGDATPTQIRALREVHPDIYGSLRAEVLKQVGQAGQKIPFETLRGLDNLFDIPGVAGPSFSPGMTSTMAQAYAAGQKVPQQSLGGESVLAAPASATTKFSGLAGLA